MDLNYNHLKYFWVVAHEGNLTRAADNLHIAQSALSIQLKTLQRQLGHDLFKKEGKKLVLTEAGRMTLDYADEIFNTGSELLNRLKEEGRSTKQSIKIGVITTLSRNFQFLFLKPLLENPEIALSIISDNFQALIDKLEAHELDVVLANSIPKNRTHASAWFAHLISDQEVSLIGRRSRKAYPEELRDILLEYPLNLPSHKNNIRVTFDSLVDKLNIEPNILVEVDDMAMLRLVALDKMGLTLAPPIVVLDELEKKTLIEVKQIPEIRESFYAITAKRKFQNSLILECIENLANSEDY